MESRRWLAGDKGIQDAAGPCSSRRKWVDTGVVVLRKAATLDDWSANLKLDLALRVSTSQLTDGPSSAKSPALEST